MHLSFRRYSLFALMILASGSALTAQAINPDFQVDPKISVPALAMTPGVPVATSDENDGLFTADASAVLVADYARLKDAAFAFDRYVQMGMPYLHASNTVATPGPGLAVIWNWMTLSVSVFSATTKHCFGVQFHDELTPASSGSEWALTPCPAEAKSHLPAALQPQYADRPAFSTLEGTWYMERVPQFSTPTAPRIYVRYTMTAEPDIMGAGLFSGSIQAKLEVGAKRVISILAGQAAIQP
jgi:hypothetical protein